MGAPGGPGDASVLIARARVVVTGRVQGVFFRASTAQVARGHAVGGWVRNLPDGTVEAALEGPRSAVERVIEWCRQGPPHAHVDEVTVAWEQPVGENGFRQR